MHTETAAASITGERTDNERWADWIAKGVAREGKTRMQARAAVAVIVAAVALWLAVAVLLG